MNGESLAESKLATEIQKLLPPRLKVSRLQGKVNGNIVTGTLKIYCTSDLKSFLSDFEAVIGEDGRAKDILLDGLDIRTGQFCED